MSNRASEGRNVAARAVPLWDQLTGVKARPLQQLETIWALRSVLDRLEHAWVDTALDQGASYGDVGRALRVSRQGVRQAVERRQRLADPGEVWLRQLQADQRDRQRRETIKRRGHAA